MTNKHPTQEGTTEDPTAGDRTDKQSVQVVWHPESVTRAEREAQWGQSGCVVWFTGLSGSGKSTIANCVDQQLHARRVHSYLLDGDNVRHGLNAPPQRLLADYGPAFAQRFGLGFSAEDRTENLRRIGAVSQLFCAAGIVTLAAFVSPYRAERDRVRAYIEKNGQVGDFIEVFIDTPLAVCEHRDPKGLYKQARAGELKGFTGIDDPYEPPVQPELRLLGDAATPDQLATQVLQLLLERRKIAPRV